MLELPFCDSSLSAMKELSHRVLFLEGYFVHMLYNDTLKFIFNVFFEFPFLNFIKLNRKRIFFKDAIIRKEIKEKT